MAEGSHSLQREAQGIHIPYNWSYADASARTGASGFTSDDLGKFARQLDNNSLWMLTATTPTWVQVGGALGDYLPRDGSLAMTGNLDLDDNNIVDVNQLEIGNSDSALYYLRLFLDGVGNAAIDRGLSGFLRYMGGANYPQFYMGSNSSGGYATIDADNGLDLLINNLDSGLVRVGNKLGPEAGVEVPLGDNTDWWGEGWIKDLRKPVTSVKTGTYTAVPGEIVRVDTSSGSVTINLPDASDNPGAVITLKKTTTDSNAMIASRLGTDTVEGGTTVNHNGSREYATYASDGTSDWLRVA